MNLTIGVDVGGTKVAGGVVDEHGNILAQHRVHTPARDAEATTEAITSVIQTLRTDYTIEGVGIGIAGFVDADRSMVYFAPNLLGWRNGPLREEVEKRVRLPVVVENDANAAAWGEARFGAGRADKFLVCVTVGTGVGGGIVVNGRAIEGANSIAGEWGHNSLPWPAAGELPGPRCGCGKAGHIEAFLSGPGLLRDYRLAAGESLEPAQIVARAESGDSTCEAVLARYEERLARALASVINLLDPDVIVLGGGMSNAGRLYRNVPPRWGAHVYSDTVATRLVKAVHGDASGVRGAARLW